MALTSEWFLKRKGIMESKFLISVNYSFNIIKDSCYEDITVGVTKYLYGCVSLLAPECAVCPCL